jgi:hypothetical protein
LYMNETSLDTVGMYSACIQNGIWIWAPKHVVKKLCGHLLDLLCWLVQAIEGGILV